METTLTAGATCPNGHVTHDDPSTGPYFPAAQLAHADRPVVAVDCPAGQLLHTVRPAVAVYCPTVQLLQLVDPAMPPYWPDEHGAHDADPQDALYCPAGQGVQAEALPRENSPGLHELQDVLAEDEEEYWPAMHDAHELAPEEAEYRPAGPVHTRQGINPTPHPNRHTHAGSIGCPCNQGNCEQLSS